MLRNRRKASTPLNVMVVGREGVGKTTLLRTLLASLSLAGRVEPTKAKPIPIPYETGITLHQPVDVDCQSHKVSLTLIDTPGLPYSAQQSQDLATIMSYIESQFESTLIEELKVKRNPRSVDTMVHAILYLLPPMLPFHPVDLSAIRTLSNRANVIPLLAHADSITNRQLENLKSSLAKTLSETVDLLSFVTPDLDNLSDMSINDDEEEEFNTELDNLKSQLPLTVIGAEFPLSNQDDNTTTDEQDDTNDNHEFLEINGQKILGREYKWGIVNVDDEQHCQLHMAKYLLFDMALSGLKAFTRNTLYERYRTERLMAHAGSESTKE